MTPRTFTPAPAEGAQREPPQRGREDGKMRVQIVINDSPVTISGRPEDIKNVLVSIGCAFWDASDANTRRGYTATARYQADTALRLHDIRVSVLGE